MPRRRSKRQTQVTGEAIALTLKAIAAAISALTLATVAYYKWASQITGSKRKVAAYLAPVGLVAVVSMIGLATPLLEPQPQTVYEYKHDFEADDVAKAAPTEEIEPAIEIEPEPYVEPESYTEPEPDAESEFYTEPEPDVASEPVSIGMGYVSGTCPDLKAKGLGPFYPGDANYTSKRDGDDDGVACES
jgi:hypothetical protein